MRDIVLASASPARERLLSAAGVAVRVEPARIDESAVTAALRAEDLDAREIGAALADFKAAKIAARHPGALVIGADQILAHRGELLDKPADRDAARAQLLRLAGGAHRLHAAAVVYDGGRPVWRHVSTATMTMRPLSHTYVESYLDRNWPDIAGCVGAYKIEAEGVRLFSHIDGDTFTVLGLPLVPLLAYLTTIGGIEG